MTLRVFLIKTLMLFTFLLVSAAVSDSLREALVGYFEHMLVTVAVVWVVGSLYDAGSWVMAWHKPHGPHVSATPPFAEHPRVLRLVALLAAAASYFLLRRGAEAEMLYEVLQTVATVAMAELTMGFFHHEPGRNHILDAAHHPDAMLRSGLGVAAAQLFWHGEVAAVANHPRCLRDLAAADGGVVPRLFVLVSRDGGGPPAEQCGRGSAETTSFRETGTSLDHLLPGHPTKHEGPQPEPRFPIYDLGGGVRVVAKIAAPIRTMALALGDDPEALATQVESFYVALTKLTHHSPDVSVVFGHSHEDALNALRAAVLKAGPE